MPWSLASAAIGAVGSMSAADSQAEAAGKAKDPWSGAEPWIRDNIAIGQDLQAYYQQNPFNSIQQQGMQGQLDNYTHQNNVVIPGLLGFSQQLMGQNYQRQQPRGAAGLLAGNQAGIQQSASPIQAPQGLMAQTQSGESPLPSSYMTAPPIAQKPSIDWNAMNPLYKDPNAVQEPEAQAAPALDIPRYIGSGEMGNYSPEVVAAYIEKLRNRERGYGMPYHVGGDGG